MNLPELVQPVLTCFEDPDARVRYYACESLYNISKVARGAVLVFFNNIFDGLCKVRISCTKFEKVVTFFSAGIVPRPLLAVPVSTFMDIGSGLGINKAKVLM